MPDLPSLETTQNDFDRLAHFDTDEWDHNGAYHDFLLRQAPTSCALALEVGCGTGALARQVARQARHVLALDLSPAMIGLARERSAAVTNIDFQVANVMTYPLPAAGLDFVISVATFHHLPLAPALTRLRDALRPGGVLAILDLFTGRRWNDIFLSVPAILLSVAFRLSKNGRLRASPAARQAWAEHGQHDVYLPLDEVRRIASEVLPGARVRRHLFWRYSLVWRKPTSPAA